MLQYFLFLNGGMTMKAPATYNGKNKKFEETFMSPEYDTKGHALWKLGKVREEFTPLSGWIEFDGFVEQLPNGKWRAVRHHALYK